MSQYKHLFTPIKVGTHTYKNRIIAAPIYCGPFINIPNLDYVMKHAMLVRAQGGCAQVTLGETAVDFCGASREPFPPIDYTDFNDPTMAKLKPLVADIKAAGAKCLIELSHCGESVEKIPGVEFGMGPMGYIRHDGMEIRGMSAADMDAVIEHFIIAAKFMKEAGFDGVMIHAGHGWLLHQFLSPRINHREDEFGGSPENRARFPLALLKGVREAMGKDFILEMRVSGDECEENGMTVEDTAAFCKLAQQYVDMIHVSVGTYRNPILSGEFSSLFQPHGLNADAAAAIKKVVDIPVVVVGGINDPAFADELIDQGKCDFVALCRQLTADPFFAKKAEEGRADDINPCLRCFKCFQGPLEGVDITQMAFMFGCTVNPSEFFYDLELLDRVPEVKKNVLVVGGGIGGMQAAITACEKGHTVTLVEKSDRLGGVLFFTDHDYYKEDLKKYRDVMVRRVNHHDIKVLLNTEVTAENIASFNADAVILAIGAEPVTPPIKGVEYAKQVLDHYRAPEATGQKVVIVGGGLTGCEVGIDLARAGKDVTILKRTGKPAPDAYPMHRIGLIHEMEGLVTVLSDVKTTEITPNSVKAVDADGNAMEFAADTVLYAAGMTARKDSVAALKSAVSVPVYEIGDCVRAAKVYEAVREGFTVALSL